MARYDKYDPISGGFRAPLAADLPPGANGAVGPIGVSISAAGRVVRGTTGGNTGIAGVLVKNAARLPWGARTANAAGAGFNAAAPIGMMAGDIVDVMTNGEIVEVTGLPAGSKIYAAADGTLSTTNTGTPVGYTIEASRLVVRCAASV